MKTVLAILAAVGAASTVSAQAWDIEFSNPVLSPGDNSTRVTLSFTPAPGDWALAGIGFNVHADEVGWSDLEPLIPYPGQGAGTIHGASVLEASGGHLVHFIVPGRVAVWGATFTVTDFTPREIAIATETWRYEAWVDMPPGGLVSVPRDLPAEALGTVRVVPAPAGVALLGLGGLVACQRRGCVGFDRPARGAIQRREER